jgi:hypothetical protein
LTRYASSNIPQLFIEKQRLWPRVVSDIQLQTFMVWVAYVWSCVPLLVGAIEMDCSPRRGGLHMLLLPGCTAEALLSFFAFLCGICEQLDVFDMSVTAKKRVSRAVCCHAQLCGFMRTSGWGAAVRQIWQSSASPSASGPECILMWCVSTYWLAFDTKELSELLLPFYSLVR